MVEHPQYLDAVFRALADPTRRAMIHRLASRDLSVTELAEPFDMSLAAVSKHVKVLEKAGLIERTVRGRTHTCNLNRARIASTREWLQYYEQFWNDRLDALERALRDPSTASSEPSDDASS